MRGIRRHWRSVVLWLIAMLILGWLAANGAASAPPLVAVALFFVPAIAGILTILILRFLGENRPDQAQMESRSRKRKRAGPDRIARLLESLDENEIVELGTWLMARKEESLRGR